MRSGDDLRGGRTVAGVRLCRRNLATPSVHYQVCDTVAVVGGSAVAAVAASPAGGTYASSQTVTLTSATSGAAIYYTLDGSVSSTSSALYAGPVTLAGSSALTTLAVKGGLLSTYSPPQTYTIAAGTLAGIALGPLGSMNGYVPMAGDLYMPGPTQIIKAMVTTTCTATATNHFLTADDGFADGHRNTASVTITVSGGTRPVPRRGGNAVVTGGQ